MITPKSIWESLSACIDMHKQSLADVPDPGAWMRVKVLWRGIRLWIHIANLARMDPTEISEMTSTDEGARLLMSSDLVPEHLRSNSGDLSRFPRWDTSKPASPERMTDKQYKRYLRGQDIGPP